MKNIRVEKKSGKIRMKNDSRLKKQGRHRRSYGNRSPRITRCEDVVGLNVKGTSAVMKNGARLKKQGRHRRRSCGNGND